MANLTDVKVSFSFENVTYPEREEVVIKHQKKKVSYYAGKDYYIMIY